MKPDATQLINRLYSLILNPDLSPKEREILINAKNRLEAKADLNKTMYDLQSQLAPLGLTFELGPEVSKLYQEVMKDFPKPNKWSYLNPFG